MDIILGVSKMKAAHFFVRYNQMNDFNHSLKYFLLLKMPGPISQNGIFYSNDASSPKIS